MPEDDPGEPTPKEFLSTLTGNWASLISGGLSVPFTIVSVFAGGQYTKLLFGLLAATGIVFASYKLWAGERDERCKTHKELQNEIAKQGRPMVTVELKNDDRGTFFFCLMNYTNSPAVNLRVDDIQCGGQVLRLDLPTLVSSGFSPNIQVYCPDQGGDSRTDIAMACAFNRKKGTDVSETMLFAVRYTDQEARHEWVTFCRFHYDFQAKKFLIEKQWIEKDEPRGKPVLTFGA